MDGLAASGDGPRLERFVGDVLWEPVTASPGGLSQRAVRAFIRRPKERTCSRPAESLDPLGWLVRKPAVTRETVHVVSVVGFDRQGDAALDEGHDHGKIVSLQSVQSLRSSFRVGRGDRGSTSSSEGRAPGENRKVRHAGSGRPARCVGHPGERSPVPKPENRPRGESQPLTLSYTTYCKTCTIGVTFGCRCSNAVGSSSCWWNACR